MSNYTEEGERAPKRQRIERDSDAESSTPIELSSQSIVLKDLNETQLGERLHKVLLCIVCLELPPPNRNFQCPLGHVICEDCVTRLLAEDASKQNAQCPQCRTHINWEKLRQNLAVEQILWELPKACADCEQQVEYKQLAQHLKVCCKRLVHCSYRCLGCSWADCHESLAKHEADCTYPNMSSIDILDQLKELDSNEQSSAQGLSKCHRQLSAQRLNYVDLQLHWPVNQLRRGAVKFQIPTANMFEETWRLLVNLPHSPDTERCLSYALKLQSTPRQTLQISYFLTYPANEVENNQLSDLNQVLLTHRFTTSGQCSKFQVLPTSCQMATYRLLAMPKIVLRLWMMLN